MSGSRLPRVTRWGAVAAVAGALAVLPSTAADADTATIPGELSTAATNTTHVDLAVPRGVRVRAITGVLTMPEVVDEGLVTFRVNGRVAEIVESSLYQRVRIKVAPSDVIADGTIGLTMASTTPPIPAGCRPDAGTATLRRIGLTYTGTEAQPQTLAEFFPPAAARVDVLVPAGADDAMLEAGLTAVTALSSRYREDTEIELGTTAPPPTDGAANQRVLVLAPGRPGEVTTGITSTAGVPTLTLTGVGDELSNAARALSSPDLGLAGDGSENLAQELKPRNVERTQSLAELGASEVLLSGYGTLTHRLEIPQDAFGTPVSELDLNLTGSHSALGVGERARMDIRVNGALVGSEVLDADPDLDLRAHVPPGRLRAVNELELTLTALAADGSTCAARGAPAVEVDLDTEGSTVTATRGLGEVRGFQLFPQAFEGTLPVALRPEGQQRFEAAIDAAKLLGALQRASAAPLEIQLIAPDAFLADDRSGLFVGATSADSTTLEAPLVFSATRQVDTDDSTFEVTSQQTYAAFESIKQADRSVLMLGSWAPGNEAAPPNLLHKVTDAVRALGWAALDGDLVIADAESPAFTASSGVEPVLAEVEEEQSYVKWFVLVIGLVLLVIAFQVVVSIRRDRRLARSQREAEERVPDDEVDGSVDDLMEEPDALAGIDDETAAAAGVAPSRTGPNPPQEPAEQPVERPAMEQPAVEQPAVETTQEPQVAAVPEPTVERRRSGLKWTPRPPLETKLAFGDRREPTGAPEATEPSAPVGLTEPTEPTEPTQSTEPTEQTPATEETTSTRPMRRRSDAPEDAAPERRDPPWKKMPRT